MLRSVPPACCFSSRWGSEGRSGPGVPVCSTAYERAACLTEQEVGQEMTESYGGISCCRIAEKSTKHHLPFFPFSASGEPTSEVSLYDSWRAGVGWSSSMWASVWDFAKSVEFWGLGSNGLSILCCVCSGCRKETLNYTHLKLLANELLNYTLGY